MDDFVKIIVSKKHGAKPLSESVIPQYEIYEAKETFEYEIPLSRPLTLEESDQYVQYLANYLFEEGFEDFDIEITNDFNDIHEVTLEDDEDFHEHFGILGYVEEDAMWEAEYQGRKVKLNKPMRGDVKKFKVYVKNPKGNVVKVNFGDPNMKIKKSNPDRRRSFRARHNCDNPGPKHKARYWSCRKW